MDAYVGLLRADLTEPRKHTGYKRIPVSYDFVEFISDKLIAFPAASGLGYGTIVGLSIYDKETGGEAIHQLNLPEPVNIRAGVIPIVRGGKLYRGMELDVKVDLNTSDLCGAGG